MQINANIVSTLKQTTSERIQMMSDLTGSLSQLTHPVKMVDEEAGQRGSTINEIRTHGLLE